MAVTILDIIGPIMVGPSSSHTAGAARLAKLARHMAGGQVVAATIDLFGSFATVGPGRGTLLALTGGLLDFDADDERIRDAERLAQAAGLAVRFRFSDQPASHPNTVRLELTTPGGGQIEVTGISVGGGVVRITNLDGFEVSLRGELPTVLCEYPDRPGMVAEVAGAIAAQGLNIATMHVVRQEESRQALMSLELDEAPAAALLQCLEVLPGIKRLIYLPGLTTRPSQRPGAIGLHALAEVLSRASDEDIPISALILRSQAELLGISREDLCDRLRKALQVMKQAVELGLENPAPSASGLTGGDAARLAPLVEAGEEDWLMAVARRALAVAETNARMGRIVAAPTAGSCGVLPGCLLGTAARFNLSDETLLGPLITAGGIGLVIAGRATLSGAAGGCQAECGAAGAMAAGALVELLGGTAHQVGHAAALALKNSLGLTCDPVAGLVEVPCVRRNAFAALQATLAARLALAGVESAVPFDEVVDAMGEVGRAMPACYRETSQGGLATTPTGRATAERIRGDPGTSTR